MADTTLNRSVDQSSAGTGSRITSIIAWASANRELVALLVLMLLAAVLRIYGVGEKALHHDESLHAQFTFQLYDGRGYFHDPLMHGPFLYHAGAAVFFLFGDNDFTGRLLPALFGTALVGMPYFLRHRLGWTVVLVAAVLMTFSPTMMYVSRFFRHDPYIIVFFMAMVICAWRYLDEQKPRYLYLFALFLGLAFATMEITYIYVAFMLIYIDIMLAMELSKPRAGEATVKDWTSRIVIITPYALAAVILLVDTLTGGTLTGNFRVILLLAVLPIFSGLLVLWNISSRASEEGRDPLVWTIAIAPFAWLLAAVWPLLGKRWFGRERLPAVGDLMIVLGTLSATQFGPAIEVLPFVGDHGYNVKEEEPLRNITVTVLLVGAAYVGLLWRPRDYAIVAAAFFIPYILLFTTFFTNIDGFFSGIWGSLDYWLAQQDVRRGDQPNYYYALLTPLYEFLPMLIALPGAIWLALKGNSLTRFFLFWLLSIIVGLSIAGEKMPWLEVHIALPLTLCAAVILGRFIETLHLERRQWLFALGVGLASAAATLLMVESDRSFFLIAGVVVLAVCLGWAVGLYLSAGKRGLARGLATVAFAVLLTLTIRAAYTVSFINYDTPVEMLVYTQSSSEIPELMERIDRLAKESGMGYNLPVVVDQTDGYAWPWAWYLRHYHEVSYVSGLSNHVPRDGSVLLMHAGNVGQVEDLGYAQVPFKHRWWFNEDYRGLTLGKVFDILTTPDRLKSLGEFFLYRRPIEGNTGSTNSVAFFPESLSAFDQGLSPKPPPEPQQLADGRIIAGRSGIGPGEIRQAAGVFVDALGVVWVADAGYNRIHRFDAQGKYLDSMGRGGSEPGALNQPWGVAVDSRGYIYVADTWNHRIQKFTPTMEFVTAWGGPTTDPDPGPLHLYGPRDIVVDVDNTLWVTDTGHKRIINYSLDGEPLGSIGIEGSELGQFSEPVGLAVDTEGRLLVADAWNARIQVIVDAGTITAIPVGWDSRAVSDKPYIAALKDGRIVATDPARNNLILLSAAGERIGSWMPAPGGLPIGVAALPDGGFVFSDASRNELQFVPASAVDSLFLP